LEPLIGFLANLEQKLWLKISVFNLNLIYLFIADTKSVVWTHTLCRTQVDKNRQKRT